MTLYELRIGEDVYMGSAAEVVGFLMRSEGKPGEAKAYMREVAAGLAERFGVEDVETSDEVAFLESLRSSGVVPVRVLREPSEERTDPSVALGDGPITLGEGVDPEELPD